MDDATKAIAAIAENMTRQDITPLEEAYAFRDAMEICKLDAAGLAAKLGRQTWRIEERLSLLKLLPEYQELFASGNLGASEAFEMSRQTPANQRKLFKLISGGQVANYNQLRAASQALLDADNQVEFFPDLGGPTKDEQKVINALDKRIDQITALLQVGFNAKNEITILQKVAPGKAEQTAEKLNLIASQAQLLAAALRERRPQQEDLPAAAA
jgi:ParB family chromosome partitioning protein